MRHRSASIPAGLLTGLIAGGSVGFMSASSGCLIPDHCIVVTVPGVDWCSKAVGALQWPVGHPELAVPVLDETNRPPIGCRCFNLAEVEILYAEAPHEKFAEFTASIQQATRDECDFIVPAGWDHNCYIVGMDGPTFNDVYPDAAGTCIGDCTYVKPPPNGTCRADPNPYECEERYGDGRMDTGSSMATDSVAETSTSDETNTSDETDSGGDGDGLWRR